MLSSFSFYQRDKINNKIENIQKPNRPEFKNKKEIIPYIDQMFNLLDETYNKLQTFVPIQNYQIEI